LSLPNSTIVYVPADYLTYYKVHDLWVFYDVRPIGATAIEEVNADGTSLKPRKVLEEGRVIILMPDERKFDTNGRALGK
jgi:hypothetical protein